MASSAGVSTVLFGALGPIGSSTVVVRPRHFLTVLGFRPYSAARDLHLRVSHSHSDRGIRKGRATDRRVAVGIAPWGRASVFKKR
jgi:hypothetical protein